jgi:hypothetical protein
MVAVAVSHTQAAWKVVPRTAPQNTPGLITVIPILTPFPNVTRHIVEPITIRLKATYRGDILPLIPTPYAIVVSIIPCNSFIITPRKFFTN